MADRAAPVAAWNVSKGPASRGPGLTYMHRQTANVFNAGNERLA